MKSSSRSSWLLRHNKLPKSEKSGKRKFSIQKNSQSPYFAVPPDLASNGEQPITRLPSIDKRTANSITPKYFKRDREIQVTTPKLLELEVKLRQKDTQISALRKLYSEADYKSKSPLISEIKSSVFRTESTIKLLPAKSSNDSLNQHIDIKRRNNSLANQYSRPNPNIAEYINQASRKVLSQKKYTRSQPKIVFTNPITGITPIV